MSKPRSLHPDVSIVASYEYVCNRCGMRYYDGHTGSYSSIRRAALRHSCTITMYGDGRTVPPNPLVNGRESSVAEAATTLLQSAPARRGRRATGTTAPKRKR